MEKYCSAATCATPFDSLPPYHSSLSCMIELLSVPFNIHMIRSLCSEVVHMMPVNFPEGEYSWGCTNVTPGFSRAVHHRAIWF